MNVYFHLRFVSDKVVVTANFTMDLNTTTFEDIKSLAGIRSWKSPDDFRWASQSQQTLDSARCTRNKNFS